MAPPDEHRPPADHGTRRGDDDDALLADLTAPPTVEDARDAYNYWHRRCSELPLRRRAERREAAVMEARWKERLATAERLEYGPTLLQQLAEMLGIRWRPNPRRLIVGAGVLATLVLVVIIVVITALIVLWPELEPIVRVVIGGDG